MFGKKLTCIFLKTTFILEQIWELGLSKISESKVFQIHYLKPPMFISQVVNFRNTCPRTFYKEGILRNPVKFTGKHLCQSLFFNKFAGLRLANLFKNKLWNKCFPVNFGKILRTPFLTEQLRWLRLKILHKFVSLF